MTVCIQNAKVVDAAAANPSLKRLATGQGKTVLVCEDETLIRIYLVDLLEELGYQVLEAADGAGALEQMANAPIDLLIADLGLPDMSGTELARRLRSRWPLASILFATGRGPEDAGFSKGNTGYLAKPFTMPSLEAALVDVLARGAHSEA